MEGWGSEAGSSGARLGLWEGPGEGACSPLWGSCGYAPYFFLILHANLYIMVFFVSFVYFLGGGGEKILSHRYFYWGPFTSPGSTRLVTHISLGASADTQNSYWLPLSASIMVSALFLSIVNVTSPWLLIDPNKCIDYSRRWVRARIVEVWMPIFLSELEGETNIKDCRFPVYCDSLCDLITAFFLT